MEQPIVTPARRPLRKGQQSVAADQVGCMRRRFAAALTPEPGAAHQTQRGNAEGDAAWVTACRTVGKPDARRDKHPAALWRRWV